MQSLPKLGMWDHTKYSSGRIAKLVRPTGTGWRFLRDSRLTGMDESSRRV